MKLLVTDDSKMARKMTKKSVETLLSDIEIIEACNGQEAIDAYKEHKPDLCLMDLTMPIVDGFEATKEICLYDSSAKIIIVSADIQEGSMVKAKENGALGFIKKPINVENLTTILEKLGLK